MELSRRNIKLEFEDEIGSIKSLEGISIRANIIKTQGIVVNEANIEICNLSRVDIEYLTAWSSQSFERSKKRRMRVLAGYNDDLALLFDGDVIEAIPSSLPPDLWLKIKALVGYNLNGEVVNIEVKGVSTIGAISKIVSEKLGLMLDLKITNNTTVKNFSYSGNLLGVIAKLNKFDGITAWNDLGILFIRDIPTQESNFEINEDRSSKYISESSGMVGIPKVDFAGIEVKCLLDNRVKCGDYVYLDSKLLPSSNGVYLVYQLIYDISSRETPFYVTIYARRLKSFNKYKPRS